MFDWLFGKSLDSYVNETKKVKVNGIKFTIRKVDVSDHLAGFKVMLQTYDLYKAGKTDAKSTISDKALKEVFSEVLVAGVVHPKLSLQKDTGAQYVGDLFFDYDMVVKLYNEILTFTYGKKKLKLSALREGSLKTLMSLPDATESDQAVS